MESERMYINLKTPSNREGLQEDEITTELLTRVDSNLAYPSEKLVHLHVLLVHLLASDNKFEVTPTEHSYVLAAKMEKALAFDLLSGILDSEVREVENFMDNVQSDIVDAGHKLSSCRHSREVYATMDKKLCNYEKSFMKFRERVLELKTQSAKLPRVLSVFEVDNWKDDNSIELAANGQMSNTNVILRRQAAEKQRQILKMLENSLARELDLEKKLSELRQNEEQMKVKLHYSGQVAFRMEEATEVVWGRFLEAENAAEVLMGISKELVGRLQMVQFNLNGSFQREAELNSRLQDCIQQLDAKDATIKKLENSIAEHISRSSEVPMLMEKLKQLEEQLKKSELYMKNANDLHEESLEQLSEMENLVDSLKERIYEAEARAETAETKVTQLTDTNAELTEEINFLKGNRDSSTKKVTVLEKQLRESEIQLQHAKASSEASQEQLNMLYSAIWDMETLIEDLKSKVAKAESKTESVEEQCIVLSESNMELEKELDFLRSKVKGLEMSLDEANNSKIAGAKEISTRSRLIMDTVVQLTRERERIQNQLLSLREQNEMLVRKVGVSRRGASLTMCNNGHVDDNKPISSVNDPSSENHEKVLEESMTLSKSVELDRASEGATQNETGVGTSHSMDDSVEMVSKLEGARTEQAGGHLRYALKAIFVGVTAVIIVYLLHKKPLFFDYF